MAEKCAAQHQPDSVTVEESEKLLIRLQRVQDGEFSCLLLRQGNGFHLEYSNHDKVDIRELKINTALAAVTVWGIADRAEPLGKRLSRTEMEKLLKETHLDDKMKDVGYWEPWQNGTRGRKP